MPVVADFQVLSPIGVTISESFGGTSVSEAGTTDSYEVVLDSVPSANVAVQVFPNSQLNLGAGPGAPVDLIFTPANALQPQTVDVSAFDDAISEGLHSGLIMHSTTSADLAYHNLAVDSVIASIADNDGAANQLPTLLNEIYVDVPGADGNREYIEILANPSTALSDIWLLEIEGDGSAAGVIDNAQNLSSVVAGSNGLVLLGDGYTTTNPWSGETDAATTLADLDGGSIENGSISFLLVRDFSSSVGVDLDANNDGQLDFFPWSDVVDSLSLIHI